ncbi:heat shock factor binding protein 1 [Chrysochromulina tobinii]|uniref:Heat shock factor binding protein 1 n=1 Tax=Chrysochromulina tobinii TaxID=1460289 RepID=A0A0M0JGE0_9EUKA|nr:heat shock factor binding protein 1 [Chrysochromulina tobinii]|eukprot:KOO25500.1 heat shock factor binding protein 1 [Chrysochromulina sp. CCMP291]
MAARSAALPVGADDDAPQSTQDLTIFVQNLLQQMQGRFATMSDAIIGRIDEMGHRIDELENSIGELMAQAGIDEEPTADGAAPPARSAATPGLRDPLV